MEILDNRICPITYKALKPHRYTTFLDGICTGIESDFELEEILSEAKSCKKVIVSSVNSFDIRWSVGRSLYKLTSLMFIYYRVLCATTFMMKMDTLYMETFSVVAYLTLDVRQP